MVRDAEKMPAIVSGIFFVIALGLMVLGTYISYIFSFYLGLALVFVGASLLVIIANRERVYRYP